MKLKNTIKSKNLMKDCSEKEEEIIDEGNDSGENTEEEDEEEQEVSDGSEAENASDENDDLEASETDSDEDVSDNDSETGEPEISKSEQIKRDIQQKYQESHGKKLYIRFPRSISPEELEQKAKELSPLIVNVHKPRQKHVRFCLVDFENKANRDATLKALKKRIKNGDLEKYQIDIPRTENPEYVQQITERKIKSLENKKVKARLKRANRKAGTVNSLTSSVLVFNLPKTTSALQVRELFPTAVDVQIKTIKGGVNKDKSIAAVNLPSTMEATAAVKNKQLSLGGNTLTVKFDNQKAKQKNNKNKKHGNGTAGLVTGDGQTLSSKKRKPNNSGKEQNTANVKLTLATNKKRKLQTADDASIPSKKIVKNEVKKTNNKGKK